MSDWQPDLYLTFGKERTQPSIDLAARIDCGDPKRIVDIGCGPGNSTNVLKARWPQAEIIGVDNSQAMINEAKSKYPAIDWQCADASGDLASLGSFDIVFSNAAIQWMPDQATLLPKLFGMLNEGGVLAVQVPCTLYMPMRVELEKLVVSDKWRGEFVDLSSAQSYHTADFYYGILCKLTADIDLWETNYFHIMDTHADIVQWYSGSGLRPYLDCLKAESLKDAFISEYGNALKDSYSLQPDGKVLFPFTRIFFIARKG